MEKTQTHHLETQVAQGWKKKRKRHNLKTAREEQFLIYKTFSIILSANFSWETVEVRRQRNDLFKALKKKKKQNK